MKGIIGHKDVELKMMEYLDDKSLFSTCYVNREMFRISNCNPLFWKGRFIEKYGEKASKYKPENRSWRIHYMQVFIDLQKYKYNPVEFLDNILWRDNVKSSYFIDKINKKLVPLEEAPEWVLTNFYLLDLGEFDAHLDYRPKKISHLTPAEFLKKHYSPTYCFVTNFEKIHQGAYIGNTYYNFKTILRDIFNSYGRIHSSRRL